jgi:hypothetical protein
MNWLIVAGWAHYVLLGAVHGAIIWVAVTLWRRHRLRSAGWLAVYFGVRLLLVVHPILFTLYFRRTLLGSEEPLLGLSVGEWLHGLSTLRGLCCVIVLACIAALVASDAVLELNRKPERPLPAVLRWVRPAALHHRLIGGLMVACQVVPTALIAGLHLVFGG